MTELLIFEVNVKNVTEGRREEGKGREGEDQLGFGVLITGTGQTNFDIVFRY